MIESVLWFEDAKATWKERVPGRDDAHLGQGTFLDVKRRVAALDQRLAASAR